MGTELNVYKFGGTSQKDVDAMDKCANILSRDRYANIAVVSAPAGVTDLLLAVAEQTFVSKKIPDRLSDQIKDKYFAVVQGLLNQQEIMSTLDEKFFDRFIVHLPKHHGQENKDRYIANALALGEHLQSEIFTSFLTQRGFKANLLTENAVRLEGDYLDGTYDRKSDEEIRKQMIPGELLVMYGFKGTNSKGESVVLSRGGSNYFASFAGRAVNATAIYNCTDVNGIMTINPKLLAPEQKHLATTINEISYFQAQEITGKGATVLHPMSVDPLMERGIPMWVMNTFDPNGPRTKIYDKQHGDPKFIAVTGKSGVHGFTSITVHAGKMEGGLGYAMNSAKVFFDERIDLDTLTTSSVDITFSFSNIRKNLDSVMKKLSVYGDVRKNNGQSLVAMIGENIGNDPRLIAKFFNVLGNNGIPVDSQISKANNYSIWISVPSQDFERAQVALHNELLKN